MQGVSLYFGLDRWCWKQCFNVVKEVIQKKCSSIALAALPAGVNRLLSVAGVGPDIEWDVRMVRSTPGEIEGDKVVRAGFEE